MSPLPPVSHCSASAKTFIDTEKSRRHSGRLRSLRSHRKSMEKSQPKRKPWWIAAIFVYVLTGTFQTFGSFFKGFRGLFLMIQNPDFLEESFHEKWDFWEIFPTMCFHQFGALFCVCIRSTFILKGTDMVKGLLHEWRLSCHCQLSVSKSIIVEDSNSSSRFSSY